MFSSCSSRFSPERDIVTLRDDVDARFGGRHAGAAAFAWRAAGRLAARARARTRRRAAAGATRAAGLASRAAVPSGWLVDHVIATSDGRNHEQTEAQGRPEREGWFMKTLSKKAMSPGAAHVHAKLLSNVDISS